MARSMTKSWLLLIFLCTHLRALLGQSAYVREIPQGLTKKTDKPHFPGASLGPILQDSQIPLPFIFIRAQFPVSHSDASIGQWCSKVSISPLPSVT